MADKAPSMRLTVGNVLDLAVSDLERSGISGARNEAEILIGHVLGSRRADLYAGMDRPISLSQAAQLDKMVAARCSGRPLQYITGVQAFRRLALKVGPGVLVPRPETEMLVERCLEILQGVERPQVLDIGTGSGAIALSLATELPDCRVWATEISEDAYRWADRNLEQTGLANVELFYGDLFSPLPRSQKGKFDLIVSNPPYLSQEALEAVPAEVRDHEPEVALLSGDAGMATCVRIIREAFDWLDRGGHLVLETAGSAQWHDLRIWFDKRYAGVQITNDLAGKPRFAEGRKP
ncbi:MAG TPA: peptide chain release factor N(5)-glutamine methyltransferase [Actinomycetota bacterium]|nr:peptide chain release factor N(5)-glutamine methyltransferase [Actinomycetota bacterium]